MNYKKILSALLTLTLPLFCFCSCGTVEEAEEETEILTLSVEDIEYYQKFKNSGISINVYNWGEYISDGSDGTINVNSEFTKLTGITVNYSTYATNEELYAKLKGGGSNYDIIIPSDYMISRMIKEDMLLPLDIENVPNFKYIMDKFTDPEYDRNCNYSVPYTWGTVGIIYDDTVVEEEEIDWDILWNEDYTDRILMFDNPRDAFAIAEIILGYSLNTEDPQELKAVGDKLKDQKSVIQSYVMDEIFDKMGAGEAIIAPYYAGDAVTLMDEYESLSFVIPESGTNLFIDAMCVPKSSKNKEAAEMYINFMCEPDIAYSTTTYIGYSTPNTASFEMLDDEIKNDGISYPDDEYIANKTTIFRNLSDDANLQMQTLWTEMKSAESNAQNQWLVLVFMLACIAASLIIIIRRHRKRKKELL